MYCTWMVVSQPLSDGSRKKKERRAIRKKQNLIRKTKNEKRKKEPLHKQP